MDSLTHLDMADAIADVAVGACAVARWAERGRVYTAERTPRGIVVRVFNGRGQCIALSTMSRADEREYVARARRSAA